MKICKVGGCEAKANSLGMCRKHYIRYLRNGDPFRRKNHAYEDLGTKLLQYTVSKTGCWEWTAGLNSMGYGTLYHNGRKQYAHRLSYEHHNKTKIAKSMNILHKCDNPKCINPEHLVLGTQKDNVMDAVSKNRNAYGEKISQLTLETVIEILRLTKLGVKQKVIIAMYNLPQSTVSSIQTRRNWGWVDESLITD